jgi:hypothetical protein
MIIRTGMFFPQRENEDLSATISESSDLVNKNKVMDRAGEGVLIGYGTARGMILSSTSNVEHSESLNRIPPLKLQSFNNHAMSQAEFKILPGCPVYV